MTPITLADPPVTLTVYTHWVPRPRWAVLHGLPHETLSAARAEALRTLDDSPEVDHVDLTDGMTTVYETVRRSGRFGGR